MNKVEKVQIFNSLKDEELSIHDDENDSWCTHYILKKNKKDCLKLSREALECFYDIHIKQAAACLGISLSYMKLLRVWGDLPRWPWRDVKSGISSKFTMSDIESKRIAMINDTKTSDILLHDCLVKAQEIRGKVNAKAIASELLMKKKMYDRALARTSRKNKYKSKKKKTKDDFSSNFDWSELSEIATEKGRDNVKVLDEIREQSEATKDEDVGLPLFSDEYDIIFDELDC